jgi:hypothetical protein
MKVLLETYWRSKAEALSALRSISVQLRSDSPMTRRWAFLTEEDKSCVSWRGAIPAVALATSRERLRRRYRRDEQRLRIRFDPRRDS